MSNPDAKEAPIFRTQRLAAERPLPITVLCIGGAFVLAWVTWLALGGSAARAFGPGYWVYFLVTTGALGLALLGLWHLRPWALWVFPAALLADTAVVVLMGELHSTLLICEVVVVLVVFKNAAAFSRTPR